MPDLPTGEGAPSVPLGIAGLAGDLRGLYLRGLRAPEVGLAGADLVRADLVGAVLSGADLGGARAHAARMRFADLTGVHAEELVALDVDFEGALLCGARLTGAELARAILLEADLSGADLRSSSLLNADLRGVDLRSADLSGADLRGAVLNGARLDGAVVEGVRARGAVLIGATDGGSGAVDALISAGASAQRVPLLNRALDGTGRAGRRVGQLARDAATTGTERVREARRGMQTGFAQLRTTAKARLAESQETRALRRAQSARDRVRRRELLIARRQRRIDARARAESRREAVERAQKAEDRARAVRRLRERGRAAPDLGLTIAPRPALPMKAGVLAQERALTDRAQLGASAALDRERIAVGQVPGALGGGFGAASRRWTQHIEDAVQRRAALARQAEERRRRQAEEARARAAAEERAKLEAAEAERQEAWRRKRQALLDEARRAEAAMLAEQAAARRAASKDTVAAFQAAREARADALRERLDAPLAPPVADPFTARLQGEADRRAAAARRAEERRQERIAEAARQEAEARRQAAEAARRAAEAARQAEAQRAARAAALARQAEQESARAAELAQAAVDHEAAQIAAALEARRATVEPEGPGPDVSEVDAAGSDGTAVVGSAADAPVGEADAPGSRPADLPVVGPAVVDADGLEPAPAPEPEVAPEPVARPGWFRGLFSRPSTDPAALPEGAGVDLRGADLRGLRLRGRAWPGADLREAALDSVRLERADLSGADLSGARLESARLGLANLQDAVLVDVQGDGARLRDADLAGATLCGAKLVDSDLRGARLAGADLTGADLTGADLRRVDLSGAILREVNLTAARMADVDLKDAVLDGAILDQADLAGVQWEDASVTGADLTGALGLSGRDREALARAGARAQDDALDQLVGRFASRQVRAAVAILALGVSAYLGARYLASGGMDPAELEGRAEELRQEDPLAASEAYEELASTSLRLSDRVGYLLEAAALAESAGAGDRAGRMYAGALDEAGDDMALSTEVRLRGSAWQARSQDWAASMAMIAPVIEADGQPADMRAKAIVLHEQGRVSLGLEDNQLIDELYAQLSGLPAAEADLRLAVADIRSTQGDLDSALAELELVATLELEDEQRFRVMESRARILDRAGQLDEAAVAWAALLEVAEEGDVTWQASRLALADVRHRQGEADAALTLIQPLLSQDIDARVRGRALLVSGRLNEQAGRPEEARANYQDALGIEDIEPETVDEARISMARLLLAHGAPEDIEAALADLSPEAAAGILVHAQLGEARTRLDENDAKGALQVYDKILAADSEDRSLVRAAKAGKAECLARLGELNEAVRIWREQLADDPTAEERTWLELQLAHGLLQGGERREAAAAFASLATSEDPDVRFQGILGQAEVARSEGERTRAQALFEQVADRASDPAYQIQALQELADMAMEDDRPAEARAAWRRLLGLAPPGHSAVPDARMALMLSVADEGDLDGAIQMCRQTAASAGPGDRAAAELACAELLERAGRPEQARTAYARAFEGGGGGDLMVDAALGLGRTAMDAGEPEVAASALASALVQVEEPELRLPLLSAHIQALTALGDEDALAAAAETRDDLARSMPLQAGPLLVDAAAQARGAGRWDEAVPLLEQAAALPVPDRQRATILVELGDTLLEAGEPVRAVEVFTQVVEMEDLDDAAAFSGGMGLAEATRQSGDADTAASQMAALSPPDAGTTRWWLESLARTRSQAGDEEGALDAWRRLEDAAEGDRGARTAALRGQADVLLGADRPEEALALYDKAVETATEPAAAGWADLGGVEALTMLGRRSDANTRLLLLLGHSDPEVALQARVRTAQLRAERENWEQAIDILSALDAAPFGAGWDATVAESRAAAFAGMGRADDAASEWERLMARWPGEEEAELPALLGLADLARSTGDEAEALALAERALETAQDPGYRGRAEALVATLSER